MIKRLFTVVFLFIVVQGYSQQTYLIFSFMKVEDEHLMDYLALEDFWEKIHQEAIKDEALVGWDLWSLMPGGQEQGYQYLTVSVYDNLAEMMKGTTMDQILAWAKKAYPNMSEAEITKKAMQGSASRSRGVIMYLERLDGTDGEFEMEVGTFATMELMKANNSASYVKAEKDVFKPIHQEVVNEGLKGGWSIARIILPSGSDTYASHMTFNMYKDVDQYVKSQSVNLADYISDWDPVNKGLETRDMKWNYMATLMKKLR